MVEMSEPRESASSRLRTNLPRAGTPGGRLSVGRRTPHLWRIREELPQRTRATLMATSIATPVLLWVVLSSMTDTLFTPSLARIWEAGRELATSGLLMEDAWVSTRRVMTGFAISLAISIPLGLAMGAFRSIQALFEPFIAFVRYMPAPAFVPLLIIAMGLGEAPKIALIVIGTVFFNTLMISNVVWQVPTELIRAAFTLGAGSFGVFRKVIVPYCVPGVIDAARVNLAAAWNLVVVAELFAANEGLGLRIVRMQKFLQTDSIWALLVVIGVLGLITDLSLRIARDRLAPWSQE